MYQRMAVLAAFSCFILATPAFARDRHQADGEPCDTSPGEFDDVYEWAAFHPKLDPLFGDLRAHSEQAAPDDEQAAPDADDDSDDADEGDDDGDGADNQGCAEIMVTPYDLMIHAPDKEPLPVVLRRRAPVWRNVRT